MSCQIKYRCRAPLKILQFYSSISYARRVVACVALPSIHKDIKLKDPQIRSVTFIVDMGLCMTHNDILITIVGTACSTAAPIPPAWRRCQRTFAKFYNAPNARRRPLVGHYETSRDSLMTAMETSAFCRSTNNLDSIPSILISAPIASSPWFFVYKLSSMNL